VLVGGLGGPRLTRLAARGRVEGAHVLGTESRVRASRRTFVGACADGAVFPTRQQTRRVAPGAAARRARVAAVVQRESGAPVGERRSGVRLVDLRELARPRLARLAAEGFADGAHVLRASRRVLARRRSADGHLALLPARFRVGRIAPEPAARSARVASVVSRRRRAPVWVVGRIPVVVRVRSVGRPRLTRPSAHRRVLRAHVFGSEGSVRAACRVTSADVALLPARSGDDRVAPKSPAPRARIVAVVPRCRDAPIGVHRIIRVLMLVGRLAGPRLADLPAHSSTLRPDVLRSQR